MSLKSTADYATAETFFALLPQWAKREVSTSVKRFAFFMGLLDKIRPTAMAEVGVSAGTLSACLLYKATRLNPDVRLFGIDFGDHLYYDDSIPIAAAIMESFPDLLDNFSLHTGKTALDADEVIDQPLDFVYVDANHLHPWASIDCLCLVPHLRPDAVIGFHDTALHPCRAMAGVLTSTSLELESLQETEMDYHGTTVCRYDGDTEKLLTNLLASFGLPWATALDDRTVGGIEAMVERHFGSQWRNRFARTLAYARRMSPLFYQVEDSIRIHELDLLRNSTSWRVTAPLRRLGGLFARQAKS